MKLLLAAERLFALYGPEGTSARAIMNEAQQKNASALTYHFPTREGLIEAICQLRMEPLNDDRIEQVAEYLSDKPASPDRLRALIGIICLPGLAPIVEAKGQSYFRRFLAQAINNPSSNFYEIVRGRFDTGLRQTVPLIREEVPYLPRIIADKRIATLIRTTSYLIAHLEAQSEGRPWSARRHELEFEMEMMVDGFVGFMQGAHTTAKSPQSSKLKRYAIQQSLDHALS